MKITPLPDAPIYTMASGHQVTLAKLRRGLFSSRAEKDLLAVVVRESAANPWLEVCDMQMPGMCLDDFAAITHHFRAFLPKKRPAQPTCYRRP